MQLHPLPRSLDPLAGEGLDGFLLRLSYRLERTPYRVAMLTGLIQPSGQQHTVAFGLLMHLTDDQRQAFAYATRLTPDEVADLCLSSMACQYSPASPNPQASRATAPAARQRRPPRPFPGSAARPRRGRDS